MTRTAHDRAILLAAADALEGESWYLQDRLADDADDRDPRTVLTAEQVIAGLRRLAIEFGQ